MTDRPVSWLVVEPGWSVVAADGSDAGKVSEVIGDKNADIFDGLAVSTGALSTNRYVAAERVGEITEGRVALALTPDEVERLPAWDGAPATERVLAETASLWDRIAGWFRPR